jgi:hypothetical protein
MEYDVAQRKQVHTIIILLTLSGIICRFVKQSNFKLMFLVRLFWRWQFGPECFKSFLNMTRGWYTLLFSISQLNLSVRCIVCILQIINIKLISKPQISKVRDLGIHLDSYISTITHISTTVLGYFASIRHAAFAVLLQSLSWKQWRGKGWTGVKIVPLFKA